MSTSAVAFDALVTAVVTSSSPPGATDVALSDAPKVKVGDTGPPLADGDGPTVAEGAAVTGGGVAPG